MAFDEQGQLIPSTARSRFVDARTRCSRQAGSTRSHHLDPNILAIATASRSTTDYAINFIEATRLIKPAARG